MRAGHQLGSSIVGRCLWLLVGGGGISLWSVSWKEQGKERRGGANWIVVAYFLDQLRYIRWRSAA